MPKMTRPKEDEWIQPNMTGYRLGCCDCGLVHDMDFKVVRVTKDLGHGYKEVKNAKAGQFIVHFRARRNNRSTAQLRRKR